MSGMSLTLGMLFDFDSWPDTCCFIKSKEREKGRDCHPMLSSRSFLLAAQSLIHRLQF